MYMGDGVAEMRVVAGGQVVFNHRRGRAAAQFDELAQVPGLVGIGGSTDEHQVQRLRHLHAVVDPQHRAFAGQRGDLLGGRVDRDVGVGEERHAALHDMLHAYRIEELRYKKDW